MTPARISSRADRRPDHLGAAVLDAVAELLLAPVSTAVLLRLVAARLALQADQHVVGRAEILERDVAEAEPVERRSASCARSAGPLVVRASMIVPPLKSMP